MFRVSSIGLDQVIGPYKLTQDEAVKIQQIAAKYKTVIYVGGSASANARKNEQADAEAGGVIRLTEDGHGEESRSDIDFIFNQEHKNVAALEQDLLGGIIAAGAIHPECKRLWEQPNLMERRSNYRFRFEPENKPPKVLEFGHCGEVRV